MKRFVATVNCLLAISFLMAQDNIYNEVSIASPEAASLGKFVDIPVNYHTGTPGIDIPIYAVKEGPLTLPISLSYHASGLRVMEPASWVGAGWALNAGGVITRTVNGAPDERNTGTTTNTYGHFSDGGYSSYVTSYLHVEDPEFFYSTPDWDQLASGMLDGEPDMFSFNFMEYSGKFYFREDQSVEIVPEQDLSIEADYVSNESIQGFTVTTTDGRKFYFGKTNNSGIVDPVEYSKAISPGGGTWLGSAISAWYLHKIESVNGHFTIDLSYESQTYGYHTISMFPVKQDAQGSFLFPANDTGYGAIKILIEGVRLSQINFSNGQIDFVVGNLRTDLDGTLAGIGGLDPNTEAKALDSIKITDSGAFCKVFDFDHGYFEDSITSLTGDLAGYTIDSDRRRLRLDRITEVTCDGSLDIPPYEFEYFQETLVPRRLSFARDHWGYYNGQNNTGLIPTYTENYLEAIPGADRDPSWPEMREGTLKTITYPAGASTTLDYEPHDTWVDFTSKDLVQVLTFSVGFDGNNQFDTRDISADGSTYRLKLSNGGTAGEAILNIYGSTSGLIQGFNVQPGVTFETEILLPPETITFEMKQDNTTSGDGAELWVYQVSSVQVTGDVMVGGLRIKTITQKDGLSSGNPIVTDYDYDDPSQSDISSGQLFGRPTYVQVLRNDIRKIGTVNVPPTGPYIDGCLTAGPQFPYYKSPSGIRPMESTEGNHIGYDRVEVRQTGNGYTVYEYFGQASTEDIVVRNVDNTVCDPNTPNFPDGPLPLDPQRGKLKKEWIYDENDSLLLTRVYTYLFQEGEVGVPGLKMDMVGGLHMPTFYDLDNHKLTQVDVVTTQSDLSGNDLVTTDITYYESDHHHQQTRTTKTGSLDEDLETQYRYALDLDLCAGVIYGCDAQYILDLVTSLTQYQSDLAACDITSTNYDTCSDQECNVQVCKFGAWHIYQDSLQSKRRKYLTCRQTYNSDFDACIAALIPDASLAPVREMYEVSQNPVLEISNFRDGELLNARYNIYELDASDYLYPDELLTLNLSAPSLTFSEASVNGSTMDLDTRYEPETGVKYKQDNLVELTGKDSISISYLYGHSETLPIVRATGVDHATLETAFIALGQDREALRSHASTQHAQITTYYYDPLFGITKIVDANGRASYYDYDKLGRLVEVKDHDGNVLKRYNYQYNYQLLSNPAE